MSNKNKQPVQQAQQELDPEEAINIICKCCVYLRAYEREYGYGELLEILSAAEYIYLKDNLTFAQRTINFLNSELLTIEKELTN